MNSGNSFFSKLKQKEIKFGEDGQYTGRLPLKLENFHAMGGLYLIDLSLAKKLVPANVSLISPFPGKAILAIGAMEYLNSDIGPYNELAIAVVVAPGKSKQKILAYPEFLFSAIRRQFHLFIHQLPVTTDISVVGGVQFFHLPKFKADISFRENKTHRICTVRDYENHELILEIDAKKIKTRYIRQDRLMFPLMIRPLGNNLKKSKSNLFKVNFLELGLSVLIPRMALRFGKHALGEELKKLNPRVELLFFFAPQCEGILEIKSNKGEKI